MAGNLRLSGPQADLKGGPNMTELFFLCQSLLGFETLIDRTSLHEVELQSPLAWDLRADTPG